MLKILLLLKKFVKWTGIHKQDKILSKFNYVLIEKMNKNVSRNFVVDAVISHFTEKLRVI